jgi:hypothetical protein
VITFACAIAQIPLFAWEMLVSSDWGEQPELGRGATETGRAGGNPRKSAWALRFVGYYERGDLWAQPCCNDLSGLSGNVRDYKVCGIFEIVSACLRSLGATVLSAFIPIHP